MSWVCVRVSIYSVRLCLSRVSVPCLFLEDDAAKRRRIELPKGQKAAVLAEWTVSGARFDSPLYLQRESRCQQLMQTLRKDAVVLIRSPPLTGKTTMCSEMAVYADEQGLEVLNISLVDLNPKKETFDELFTRKIQRTFRQIVPTTNVSGANE